ncbi:MAG: ATP-grasp domain-containing protein, partial [Thermoanaerobaculia bacterium]
KESKKILMKEKLPVPPYAILRKEDKKINLPFPFPVIVKPLCQDGSCGITENSVVWNKKNLKKQVEFIFENFKDPALVEPFLQGREFNVSVIGRDKRIALPVSEIDYSQLPSSIPKILTYSAKWSKDNISYELTKPVCPAKIDKKFEKRLKLLALKAGKALSCRDYYRVDFRTDTKGNAYIIEVNPNPDISPDAGLARALKAYGIDYEKFILRLLKWAE